MSHPKRPRDPKGPLWRLRHNSAPFSQQGRAVAAYSTFRWSHFAYAISWRTSSSECANFISDRHNVAVGVNFDGKTKRHRFSPNTTVGVATDWALRKFHLDPAMPRGH